MSLMLEDTASVPAVPVVLETSDRLCAPLPLVTIEAVTPMPAVLIASSSPVSVFHPLAEPV